jgi:site-specific recombinase XerD
MSVYRRTKHGKRGKYYWYKFWFANKLIRESAKTTSKTLAKTAEKNRRRELEEGYNGVQADDKSRRVRTLDEAAAEFLASYRLRCRPTTYSFADHCVRHLRQHMGEMMLIEIGDRTVLDYQSMRLKEEASGKTINEEVRVLLQIMGDMGDPVRLRLRRQKKLKVAQNPNCGKAISCEEESKLLEAAKMREPDEETGRFDLKDTRSPMIHTVIVTALNTGMRDCEIRTLRWEQLDFLRRIVTVGKSKTNAGTGRTIPMNDALFEALAEHKEWFEENVCAVTPVLYVFPFGKNRQYDPKRPISSFKSAWTNVRKKAGVWVRLHDLRHTLITKLAESGASEETIMAIAGHVSRSMLTHYAHIRTEAKRKALDAVATSRPSVPATESESAASAS